MDTIKNKGIYLEYNYPYKAKNQTCKNSNAQKLKISSYTDVKDYDLMGFIKALHKQPVTVAYYVSSKFFSYKSGIIDVDDNAMCPKNITGTNHAVMASGYGFNPDKSRRSTLKTKLKSVTIEIKMGD